MNKISSASRKVTAFTLKTLGTVLIWLISAALAKVNLDPREWRETLSKLPLITIVCLLVFLPVAWLIVEFIATCFIEVRVVVLESSAPKFAQWLTNSPAAVSAVLGRSWDAIMASFDNFRFTGRYNSRMVEECEPLHTQTGLLHATAEISLEEAYVDLSMASEHGTINPRLLASEPRGHETVYSFLRTRANGTVLAILGRPGGGKTTLLRYLALLYAKNRQGIHRLRRRVPVVIELRRVADRFTDHTKKLWEPPSLEAVIELYWRRHLAFRELIKQMPPSWLCDMLNAGRMIVLIDGLDEVPHRPDLVPLNAKTARQRVAEWIETEMQREGQRQCLFVVTSRPGGFKETPLTNRSTILEVQPLTPGQGERYIQAFNFSVQRRAHPAETRSQWEADARLLTQKFLLDLRTKPHLSDLSVNPLLLHLMCLLHYLRGRLPPDRSDLYKETCEVLLNRDLRAPGYQEQLRPEDKLTALRPLADYFMRSESPEPKRTEVLLPIIEPVFKTLTFPSGDFFTFTANDSGLLQQVEDEHWDFAHKTFYEYLTAEHWEKHPPSYAELIQWIDRDWWRVTLLFYSAKAEDSEVMIACLQSLSPNAWSLLFDCLASNHRLNVADRTKANKLLKEALSTPEKEDVFGLAASALLDLRMKDVVPISDDGKMMQRSSLISQAEYQLFLFSLTQADRWRFVPFHWSKDVFDGDPEAPVVGVDFFQATIFARWLSRIRNESWDIPIRHEAHSQTRGTYWVKVQDSYSRPNSDFGGISDLHEHKKRELIQWMRTNALGVSADENWEQLISSRRVFLQKYVAKQVRSSPNPVLWLNSNPYTREDYLIGAEVCVELDIALRRPLPSKFENLSLGTSDLRMQDEMLLADYYRSSSAGAIGAALRNSLGLDEVFRDLPRVVDHVSLPTVEGVHQIAGRRRVFDNLVSILFDWIELKSGQRIGKPDTDTIEKLRNVQFIRTMGDKSSNILARLAVMESAIRLMSRLDNPLMYTHAWICHGKLLTELCVKSISGQELGRVRKYNNALAMLKARAEGTLEAWESIMLVKTIL